MIETYLLQKVCLVCINLIRKLSKKEAARYLHTYVIHLVTESGTTPIYGTTQLQTEVVEIDGIKFNHFIIQSQQKYLNNITGNVNMCSLRV